MRRHQVTTPALLLDIDALDSNIALMVEFARSRGVALRPHAKSHKSVDIARRLIKSGALGACCATIGEAEALAAGGIGGILVTSPLTAPHMLERLRTLLFRGADVMVVADDTGNVAQLAEVAAAAGGVLPVVVELDVGIGRTGCRDVPGAVAVARAIAAQPSLNFAGVQAYWGHLQLVTPYTERRRRVEQEAVRVRELISILQTSGLPPPRVPAAAQGRTTSMPPWDCSPSCRSGRSYSSTRFMGPPRLHRMATPLPLRFSWRRAS